MKHQNNIKLLLCLFFLISIVMIHYTFAKYQTTLTASDKAKVGLFTIKDNINETMNIDIQAIDPDNPITYTFYIQNYDDKGTSEVNIQYKLILKTEHGNLPLEYTLYKEDVMNNILDEQNTYTDFLYYDKEEKLKFTLIISMPKDAYDNQDMIDSMNIYLEAIQID